MFFFHNYPCNLGHMVPKSLTNPGLHPVRQKGFTLKFPHQDEPAAEGIFTHYSILHMLNN